MFGVLCARQTLVLLSRSGGAAFQPPHSDSCALRGGSGRRLERLLHTLPGEEQRRRLGMAYYPALLLAAAAGGSGGVRPPRERTSEACRGLVECVAWDARPARWLHNSDSAWLLFGVSAGAPPVDLDPDSNSEVLVATDDSKINNYRVIGVTADGRCLFRAIAHMACLRKGEVAPDEIRQKELADELRAQVVEELLKRRKEVEWFIDEEFDMYVKRIEQPYIWGGEPELLMCSHVLRAPIQVFMKDKGSTNLIKVAKYGDEYKNEEVNSINVLFHGYGRS